MIKVNIADTRGQAWSNPNYIHANPATIYGKIEGGVFQIDNNEYGTDLEPKKIIEKNLILGASTTPQIDWEITENRVPLSLIPREGLIK